MTTLLFAVNNPRYCDEVIFGQFHAPKWVYKAFNDPAYAEAKWLRYAPFLQQRLHLPNWVPEGVANRVRQFSQRTASAA